MNVQSVPVGSPACFELLCESSLRSRQFLQFLLRFSDVEFRQLWVRHERPRHILRIDNVVLFSPAAGTMKRTFSKYMPAHARTTTVARQSLAAQT